MQSFEYSNAPEQGIDAFQHRHNKALHPTAYSSAHYGRSSLRSLCFRRRVSLVVVLLRLLDGNLQGKSTPEFRRTFVGGGSRLWRWSLRAHGLKYLGAAMRAAFSVYEYSFSAVCFACGSNSLLLRGSRQLSSWRLQRPNTGLTRLCPRPPCMVERVVRW